MYKRFMQGLRRYAQQFPDVRKGGNHQLYTVADGCLSAFGVFFTQTPSFLAYQCEMQVRQGRDNAQSLFGVTVIPSDNEIRNLLDPVAPSYVGGLFWDTFADLEAQGQLAEHHGFDRQWLCALDGVQYFSSDAIHCEHCTRRQKGNKTFYTHSVIAPVLVAPGHDYVLSLEPEFITPQDGADKQDSEQAAMRRWIERHAHHFAPDRLTVLTDDLHSHQPACVWLRAHHCHFILVCLPESHPFLYEQVAELTRLNLVSEVVAKNWNGRHRERWTYRFVNDVLLRDSADAVTVNWCEIIITQDDTQALLYHNTFITDHALTEQTVAAIVASGRARWKTENENHNTLKHHGYHLEHNFGHGQQHLSTLLLSLNLLAFLLHTALTLTDATYQQIRHALGARRTFFDDIRTLTRYLYFDSWAALLAFMAHGLELDRSP
jgi:hypothetical protein